MLENALYVPSFKHDIFSVQAATVQGARVEFMPDSAQLKSSDGVNFDIEKHGRLYFLNHVKSSMSAEQSVRSLKEWHEVLGHCNIGDFISVEKVVEGMKITGKRDFECGVCVEGKMTQYRCREPDKRATKPLDLVHADLAGPVDPMAKDGFRYALAFVDDYSGLVMIYFLKHKGDTVNATKRFLADSAPYGIVKRLRTDQGEEFLSDEFENLLVQNKIKTKGQHRTPHIRTVLWRDPGDRYLKWLDVC